MDRLQVSCVKVSCSSKNEVDQMSAIRDMLGVMTKIFSHESPQAAAQAHTHSLGASAFI